MADARISRQAETMADTQEAHETYEDPYNEPLQYLNRVARFLTGWFVIRQFETNVPRLAREIEKSGPHAAALWSSCRTFQLYAIGIGYLAIFLDVFGITMIAYPLLGLFAICIMCEVACLVSARKPQREYRRAREARRD